MAREQWTKQQAWDWHDRVGVIKGFNEPVPAYPGMTEQQVLEKAADLGFNSVRVFLGGDQEQVISSLGQLLDDAEAHGLTVSPVLPSKSFVLREDREAAAAEAKALIQGIVREFRNDQRIVLWDLMNEPGVNDPERETEYLEWCKRYIEWAREVAPSQPITVSSFFLYEDHFYEDWYQEQRAEVQAMCDVHNFHLYDLSVNRMEAIEELVAVLKNISDRPMVATEVMARTRGGTFARTLTACAEHDIRFYSWGLFVNDKNWHVAWGESAFYSADPWFHEVLHPDGSPYDWRDLELIREFRFADADEQIVPEVESTERWNKWRAWKWMAADTTRGWTYRPHSLDNWEDMWSPDRELREAWQEDLARAAAAGANALRVHFDFDAWQGDPVAFERQVERFLAIAEENGMSVTPVLLTDADTGHPIEELTDYIGQVMAAFGTDERILMWEIYDRPGGTGIDRNMATSVLYEAFRTARFEFVAHPFTATPAVSVEPFEEDFDHVDALRHGGSDAGWNRLQYDGSSDGELCAYVWKLSDVLSIASDQRKPETGWLLSVANRYGRPIITSWSPPDKSAVKKTLDHFSSNQTGWFNTSLDLYKIGSEPVENRDEPSPLQQKSLFDAKILDQYQDIATKIRDFKFERTTTPIGRDMYTR